ncbi:MAG TPA: nitroreductase family protein, partial [Pseudonocardia sp.]
TSISADAATLRGAVASAIRAPSVYNSQPWRWRASTSDGIDLFADPNRHLITTDPDGRDLLLSCGAALHHLTVALAALGWTTRVARLPDPENLHHLARVSLPARTGTVDPEAARLAEAIPRRRTDRGRFGPQPVPAHLLDTLVAQADAHGARLHVVSGTARRRLISLIAESASLQQQQLGYAAEAARWTGRHTGSGDGIRPANLVAPGVGRSGDVPMRPSPRPGVARPTHALEHDDASVLAVLTTASDERGAVLRAGEATSAVLLTATAHGLASTPLSQPLEVAGTRTAIGTELVGADRFAQLVLRVGRAFPDAPELPPSPRRPLRSVLAPVS